MTSTTAESEEVGISSSFSLVVTCRVISNSFSVPVSRTVLLTVTLSSLVSARPLVTICNDRTGEYAAGENRCTEDASNRFAQHGDFLSHSDSPFP